MPIEKNNNPGLSYIALYAPHKGTWKLSNKPELASGGPMWFWRTVHAHIEICNRKGFKKKHRALQVRVFHIIHANGGAAARPENCAWSTSEKLQKYNSEYNAFDFCHYCTLKSKHIGFKLPYV